MVFSIWLIKRNIGAVVLHILTDIDEWRFITSMAFSPHFFTALLTLALLAAPASPAGPTASRQQAEQYSHQPARRSTQGGYRPPARGCSPCSSRAVIDAGAGVSQLDSTQPHGWTSAR
jgi:hypothetical protein